MKSLIVLAFLCSLLCSIGAAREYWRGVMKDQPLSDAVQAGLVDKMENDCHDHKEAAEKLELIKEETFMVNLRNGEKMMMKTEEDRTKDFEPRPDLTAYGDKK